MDIDKNKSGIPKYSLIKGNVSNDKFNKKNFEVNNEKSKGQKFISQDVKNYFSYNLKNNFGRSSNSKNFVTYDLKSFDEDKS
jgi:hypothetical protein